jgi:hypothetical protein
LWGWLAVGSDGRFGGVGNLIWMLFDEVFVAGVVVMVVLLWAGQDRAREQSSLLPLSLPVHLTGTESLWIRSSQVVTPRETWVVFVRTLTRCVSGDTASNRGARPTQTISAFLWLELVHDQPAGTSIQSRHFTAAEYSSREATAQLQGCRRREGRE